MTADGINSVQALKFLMEGNKRFMQGLRSVESLMSTANFKQFAEKGQRPFAMVLTCADSRVPAEVVFDRGVGDLFVMRVAGNVVATSLIASMEFAVTHFGTPLLVVMGHSKCGAIEAAIECECTGAKPGSPNLDELIGKIRPAVREVKANEGKQAGTFADLVTLENVRNSVKMIADQSPILKDHMETGRLLSVGSVYDISTGRVYFDTNEQVDEAIVGTQFIERQAPK